MLTALLVFAVIAGHDIFPMDGCSWISGGAGLCESGSVSEGGTAIDLEGLVVIPGERTALSPDEGSGGGDGTASEDIPCAPALPDGRCQGWVRLPGPTPAPGVPTVTITDVAQFVPSVGVSGMEPDGWMAVGLPTNFFADVGTHVADGTLLGQPASVRFTPVQWNWTYGDGTSASTRTSGAPWATLGVPEFSTTDTSHIFETAGAFTISLSIDYIADYRIGGGAWIPVAGSVRSTANDLTVTAVRAQTVLVDRDCAVLPAGPGC